MKQLNLLSLSLILLLSIYSQAQLNYLFSAEKKPYIPVTGGITPHLQTNYGGIFNGWTVEDEGFAKVPIGFTFNYDGKNYTSLTVCANGFATLGDTLSKQFNFPLWINFLASGPAGLGGERPVIAPFWDDHDLVDTLNLVYKTTGHYPNRVFTVEWKKIKWTVESTSPSLSIEMKLYEKNNAIEFHYRDEGGTPFAARAFATIGISSFYRNRGFVSLQNASADPGISLLKNNDSLTTKPANNQVYRFTPSPVAIPEPLQNSISYTNKTVSFELETDRQNGGQWHWYNWFQTYEYAITRSPIIPSSGRKTFFPDVDISSLSPATTYYLYARSIKYDRFYSQWTCFSFTTAVDPVSQPYHISGIAAPGSLLPDDLRVRNIMDTGRSYNESNNWQLVTDFPAPGDTTLWELNLNTYNANSWLYTPGIKLKAGKTYQLKFSYVSYYTNVPGEPASLEVKYGRATGEAAMKQQLFKNLDIRSYDDYDEYGGLPKNDTTIEITPYRSDEYYFGFHNQTPLDGAVLMLSNVSIAEKAAVRSSENLITLNGTTNNTDNFLNWQSTAEQENAVYKLQSSTNGISFVNLANINHEATGKKNSAKASVRYRLGRNTDELSEKNMQGLTKEKVENIFAKKETLFGLQQSKDGINFMKIKSGKNNTSNAMRPPKNNDATIKGEYTDRNVNAVTYYRMQRTDKNGKISLSNTIALSKGISFSRVYPNPAVNRLTMELSSPDDARVNLLVTDMNGKTVMTKPVQVWKGANSLQLELKELPAGTYFIKIGCTSGCESSIRKFIKE